MATSATPPVTQLLLAWNRGDKAALDQLVPVIYDELHRLARHYMRREHVGHQLQTTALIHETYLKLIDARQVEWQNRAHFFAIAARLMRQVLVDFARQQHYQKRGGGEIQVPLEDAPTVGYQTNEDVVALDEALHKLAEQDERKSQVVEMRFFGGLTEEEIAEVLHVSTDTVRRDWRLAKAWLFKYLSGSAPKEL